MVSPSKWKQLNKQTRTNKRVWNNAIQGMDNSFIPRKKLTQHIIGNGIQCMDGDGNLSAQPGQQVEVSWIGFEVSIISCDINNNKYANINEL